MYLIKQISVFVENKPGRLKAMTNILKENNIDIRALSIADTKDFGILRIVVNDTDKACDKLLEAACTVTVTEVVAVSIDDEMGSLSGIIGLLNNAGVNIEYLYSFLAVADGKASIILRVDDNEKAREVLTAGNIALLTEKDICEM